MESLIIQHLLVIQGIGFSASSRLALLLLRMNGSTTTDREPTDHEQTDRGQCQLAEKGNPKYIFTIPRAILPKPSLRDEMGDETTVIKSSLRSQFVCGQFVAVS